MSFTAYWNGDWIPLDQMRIDPLDRGFTVADATFEATRTFDGKMFRLDGHIERLYRSLQYIPNRWVQPARVVRCDLIKISMECVTTLLFRRYMQLGKFFSIVSDVPSYFNQFNLAIIIRPKADLENVRFSRCKDCSDTSYISS